MILFRIINRYNKHKILTNKISMNSFNNKKKMNKKRNILLNYFRMKILLNNQ